MRLAALGSLLVSLCLVACGGGAGGGGSDGGNFSISTRSVAFEAKHFGTPSPEQRVQLKLQDGGAAYVGAAYQYGPAPDWLTVYIDGSRPNFEVVLWASTTTMPPGHYATVLSVGTADDEGHILEYEDIQITYDIVAGMVISDAPFAVTTVAGTGEVIPGRSVQVRGSGLSYQATSSASWLSVPTGIRTADDWLPLSFDATGLTPGTYESTVTVRNTADSTDTASLVVSLMVTSPEMAMFPGSLPAAGTVVFGSSVQTARSTLQVTGSPTTYVVSTSTPWLTVPTGAQTGPGIFHIDYDATGLDVGTHTGSVRLTNQADPLKVIDVPVTLTVRAPQFAVSGQGTFGGQNGRDTAPMPVSFTLDTGTNAYPWTLSFTSPDGWLQATGATSGSVNQTTPASTVFDAARGMLTTGTYGGSFTLTAQVLGKTITETVPVTLVMAENRLEVSELGVAFSDFPSRKTLSRSLTVRSTYGLTDVPWTATSDQAWLTATASGTTGGALQLRADPTGLAPGMTHFANVTVSSPRAAVQNTQVVRVGLWVGLTDPETVETTEYQWLGVFSPTEPISYGVAYSGSIMAYNLYSGTLAREITGLGTTLSGIRLSADGRIAYVDDQAAFVVKAVDLVSGAILQTFPYIKPQFSYGASMFTLRIRGREFLIVQGDGPANVYDVPTGALVTTVANPYYSTAQSPDFLDHYTLWDIRVLRRIRLEYSEVDNVLSFTPTQDQFESQSVLSTPAVSRDGASVYLGESLRFHLFDRDLQSGTTTADVSCCARNVITMTNGLWAAVADDTIDSDPSTDPDLYFFTPDGEIVDAWSSGPGQTRLFGVSSDATRVVTTLTWYGTTKTFFRNTPVAP